MGGEGLFSRKAFSVVAHSVTPQTFPGVHSVQGARPDAKGRGRARAWAARGPR